MKKRTRTKRPARSATYRNRPVRRAQLISPFGIGAITDFRYDEALMCAGVDAWFAIEIGWRTDDPTLHVKRFRGSEFHSWTDEEITAFEGRWPLGTRERIAFALHLYTGQRRSDVCRMGWPDIEDGTLRVTQLKTDERLWIPVHPDLRIALESWPRTHVMILTTAWGKPFSAAGYGNWMSDAIRAAGLPDRCVLHGLRKAAARRLAEAGCSEKEVASITGHRTLKEVERYTRGASQRRLANAAVARLTEHMANRNSQPDQPEPAGLGKTEKT